MAGVLRFPSIVSKSSATSSLNNTSKQLLRNLHITVSGNSDAKTSKTLSHDISVAKVVQNFVSSQFDE